MKTKRARFATLVFASVMVLWDSAEGGGTNGRWTGTAPQIPYYLCCNQFPGGCTTGLVNNFASAAETWNTYGSSNVRLVYSGTTTHNGCTDPDQFISGAVLLTTFYEVSNVVAQVDCNTPNITHCRMKYNTYNSWTTGWPTSTAQRSLQQTATHEFGHVLGLTESNIGVYAAMNQGNFLYKRHLWYDDITTLRSSYGLRASQPIIHMRSTDNALSWQVQTSNMTEYTNLSVSVAYGLVWSWPWFIPNYAVAWVAANDGNGNTVHTILGDGTTFGSEVAHSGSITYSSPSIAYGDGYWLMAYTETADAHRTYLRRSTNGVDWTTLGPIQLGGNYITAYRSPVLTYTQTATQGYFVLGWVRSPYGQIPPDPDVDSEIHTILSTDGGSTWSYEWNYNIVAPHGLWACLDFVDT